MPRLIVTGPDGSCATGALEVVLGCFDDVEQPVIPTVTNRVKISDHFRFI